LKTMTMAKRPRQAAMDGMGARLPGGGREAGRGREADRGREDELHPPRKRVKGRGTVAFVAHDQGRVSIFDRLS